MIQVIALVMWFDRIKNIGKAAAYIWVAIILRITDKVITRIWKKKSLIHHCN